MTWREKLGIQENNDTSDTSGTSVTCVTSSVDTEKAESPCLAFDPEHPVVVRARALLNQAGIRAMVLDGLVTIGLWSDLDGPEIREALRTLGHERLSVLYLDGADVPIRYKLQQVQGEPVPLSVLAEMDRHPADPWKVRDRILREIGWFPKRCFWGQRKAATLNRLFQEQGVTGQPGRIRTAAML